MTCIQCHSAELQEQKADVPATVKGEAVVVTQMDALVCPNCNYTTVKGSHMSEYMRRASDVYREKHGFLTSDELRQRREALRMTQEEFAPYVPVSLASVKRWERGQVQDEAMDKLLRLRTDINAAMQNYVQVAACVSDRAARVWLGTAANMVLNVNERQWVSHPREGIWDEMVIELEP
jgi:putative zinc finger/helix-turn-helix YgiT family protein